MMKRKIEIHKDYNIRLNLSDFELLQKICDCPYGYVRLSRYKKTKKIYAMKLQRKSQLMAENQADHAYNEFQIISKIYHPFIIDFKGIILNNSKHLAYIYEYISGGFLSSYLNSVSVFPLDQAIFYLSQIIVTFEYLHSNKIVYRNLKPENILISTDGYIRLYDFFFAKELYSSYTFTMCGTSEYMAPEVILGIGHSFEVDWWACGILFYEMLVGIDPFNDEIPIKLYEKILKGTFSVPENFDSNAHNLIKSFLKINATERLGSSYNGIKNIIDHKIFKDFPWKELMLMNIKAPYIPTVKNEWDSSNFRYNGDNNSESNCEELKGKDIFADW